ncbi:3174_t:CDS:2 [Entrophospora sp. SA101]|nr:3174_t:CDS:2 [Entrophospora sp. SA101]
MVLNSSITKKLSVIFQTDYSDMIMRIIMETTGEKNYKTSEESRFLFFIRHTLVDFVAMFKYLSPRVLVRDMSERLYIVECLSPILCAFRNAFPDVKYELIDAMEILYVEVSGSPYKHDKKHTIRDVKKLLVMAVCNLCRILSNNFDCSIDDAKQVRTYSIQAIGD